MLCKGLSLMGRRGELPAGHSDSHSDAQQHIRSIEPLPWFGKHSPHLKRVMIKVRTINIDINGPQDSPSEVGQGSIDMWFTVYSCFLLFVLQSFFTPFEAQHGLQNRWYRHPRFNCVKSTCERKFLCYTPMHMEDSSLDKPYCIRSRRPLWLRRLWHSW